MSSSHFIDLGYVDRSTVLVSDFGECKRVSLDVNDPTGGTGTMEYTAPELVGGLSSSESVGSQLSDRSHSKPSR